MASAVLEETMLARIEGRRERHPAPASRDEGP